MDGRSFLQLLHQISALDHAASLGAMARRAALSPFHFHRRFRVLAGETPKAFTQRLRLQRAANRLLAAPDPVWEIARASGFSGPEVFNRAFRRQFGCTPAHYRSVKIAAMPLDVQARHLQLTAAIAPCVRVFHFPLEPPRRRAEMTTLSISRQQFPGQALLLIRRRIARAQLQGMLAECFGKLFSHGAQAGLPIAGWPLARYVSMGPGLWTVEAAMPLAAPAAGTGEMEPGILPAGPVALAIHAGPYEQLSATNAAAESWIEEHGWRVGGSPWESYVTDPAQHPDPADWRTEVYWPIAE